MRKLTLLFLATMFSIIAANAQGSRIFGYLPDYREPSTIDYTRITDAGYSFMNPDVNGNAISTTTNSIAFGWNQGRFNDVKTRCNNAGVNLWLVVGGADANEVRETRLYNVSKDATKRTRFAQQVLDYANTHGLKGVIIDWEFPKNFKHANATTHHKALLQSLQSYNTTKSYGLKIGIAVGGEYTNSVNHTQYVDPSLFNTSANLVDEWHIMAYDFPTSYDVNHSSEKDGKAALDKWISLGVPANKALLALPFYARNTSRQAKGFSELPGASLNSDSHFAFGTTWYYNGKATLENKTAHAISKGAAGMVIWDLGQDNANHDLLKIVDNKLASLCSIQQPDLGPNLGVCNGQSVELKSNVPTGNYTFAWFKDGASISGSTPSITVSTGGQYKVVITENGGGCSVEDQIKVVSGASITGNGWTGCRDEEATLSVVNPTSGKAYDWYTVAQGGSPVATNQSTYTFTPDRDNDGGKTLKFYIEERSTQTTALSLLNADIPGNFSWSETANSGAGRAIFVDAKKDLTINSVKVYTDGSKTLQLKVLLLGTDIDNLGKNRVVKESSVFTTAKAGGFTDITILPLDMLVPQGKYFLQLQEVSGADNFFAIETGEEYAMKTSPDNITIGDHYFTDFGNGFLEAQSQGDDSEYNGRGPFYDMKVTVGASANCGRALVEARVETCLNFEDLEAQYNVSVLPNPSSNEFTFSRGSLSGDVQVNVLTTSGDVVFSESVSNATTFGSELAAGVYVVQIIANGDIVTTKVVKQ